MTSFFQEDVSPDLTEIPDTSDSDLATKDPWIDFLICFLPSYAFLLLALRRFYKIRYYGHTHDQPDLYPLKVIKFLAYGMIVTYGFEWIMSYLNTTALNMSRKHINLALLNFFPMLAWYSSYQLTSDELKRKLAPSQVEQFLFWNLSIVFSLFKLFKEPKWNNVILLIDGCQVFFSIAITIYFHNNESELFVFVDDHDEKANLDKHLIDTFRPTNFAVDDEEGIDDVETNKEKLPKIEALISKKVQKKMLSDHTFDRYFDIKVSVNKNQLRKVSHSLAEFIHLSKELKLIYNLSQFKVLSASPPALNTEYLQNANLNDDMNNIMEMIEVLQEFLNELCSDPIYIHQIVLDFLNIPNPYRNEFTKFISYAQMINSRVSLPRRQLTKESNRDSFELKDLSMFQSRKMSARRSFTKSEDRVRYQALHLEVRKVTYEYIRLRREMVYIFEVTMIKENNQPAVWNIERTYNSFKMNNQKMKMEYGQRIPNLQDFVPSAITGLGESPVAYNQRMLEGLERYLKTIIAIKRYDCTSFIEFLGIHPGSLEYGVRSDSGSLQEEDDRADQS